MMNFKHIYVSFMLSLMVYGTVLSQHCDLKEVSYLTTGFNDSVKLKVIYDSLLNDMSGNYTFLLINSYGQVRKRKAYVLSIDSSGSIICGYEVIEDDLGLVFRKLTNTRKYKPPPSDTLTSVLLLGSSSIADAHMNSILLVSNSKKKLRLEYKDLDGDGHSCVRMSTAPLLMKYAVEVLEEVFSNSLRYSGN